MARRVNPAAGATATADHDDTPAMLGGSNGVPSDAITEIGGGAGKVTGSAVRPLAADAPAPVPTKRYEAFGCGHNGRSVLLNGYKAVIRDGKIVDEAFDDIEMLTRQGVSLRPL